MSDKFDLDAIAIICAGDVLTQQCYGAAVAAGWHTDLHTGERKQRNLPTSLMLIVTEVAEAMEGHRKDLMDDHLPHRKMVEVELADAVIRIFDTAGSHGYYLGAAIADKMLYNQSRADHKPEARLAAGGKAI